MTEVRWISRTKRAILDIASDDSVWSRMQLAIGQGTTTVTPLLNLMIYAAIANDGVMMTPYLVDHYLDADGNVVEQTKPKALRSVCTKAEAELMDEFLTYVITNGTAAARRQPICESIWKNRISAV